MKSLRIYTNLVYSGWSAKDLETGVGGSEEKLIELAKYLTKEFDVTIYHNGQHGDFDGVHYKDHREFKAWEFSDVFISFKARHILANSINADKIYHWTTEVESEWLQHELDRIDGVITISNYHNSRMRPITDKIFSQHLFIDTNRMDKNKVIKEQGTMLYASSFDRGLEELLVNLTTVKEKLNVNKLYVTYGWNFIEKAMAGNPAMTKWKSRMDNLLKQEGIEMLGRMSNDKMCEMYWKSEYWCLPLNNPDSELFCLNAVKAQYAGCKPVVRRVGALQETVNKFIDFDELLGQKVGQSTFKDVEENRKYVEQFNMDTIVKEWLKLLK